MNHTLAHQAAFHQHFNDGLPCRALFFFYGNDSHEFTHANGARGSKGPPTCWSHFDFWGTNFPSSHANLRCSRGKPQRDTLAASSHLADEQVDAEVECEGCDGGASQHRHRHDGVRVMRQRLRLQERARQGQKHEACGREVIHGGDGVQLQPLLLLLQSSSNMDPQHVNKEGLCLVDLVRGSKRYTGTATRNHVTALTGSIPIKLRTLLSWIRKAPVSPLSRSRALVSGCGDPESHDKPSLSHDKPNTKKMWEIRETCSRKPTFPGAVLLLHVLSWGPCLTRTVIGEVTKVELPCGCS